MRMKPTKTALRVLTIASLALLCCDNAFAGVASVPELDPGTASGGIALVAVAAVLLIERYRSR